MYGANARWPTMEEELALIAKQKNQRSCVTNGNYHVWTHDELNTFITSAIHDALQVIKYQSITPITEAYRAGVEAVVEALCPLLNLEFKKG